jgi:hypothetical protein
MIYFFKVGHACTCICCIQDFHINETSLHTNISSLFDILIEYSLLLINILKINEYIFKYQ